MAGDAEMLALRAQVLARRFIDVQPVQPGFLQAAQLDHFVVDRLKSFIFGIKVARRMARVQRGQQRVECKRGVVRHQ